MKRFIFLILICRAAALSAQQTLPPDAAFDPQTDSVAVYDRGAWRLPLPESWLVASASATVPELAGVRKVAVEMIQQKPHLVFHGVQKKDPGVGLFVAVQLREVSRGVYRVDGVVQTCTGNPCQACNFRQSGCVCEHYYDPKDPLATGSCNHSISQHTVMARIVGGKVVAGER